MGFKDVESAGLKEIQSKKVKMILGNGKIANHIHTYNNNLIKIIQKFQDLRSVFRMCV